MTPAQITCLSAGNSVTCPDTDKLFASADVQLKELLEGPYRTLEAFRSEANSTVSPFPHMFHRLSFFELMLQLPVFPTEVVSISASHSCLALRQRADCSTSASCLLMLDFGGCAAGSTAQELRGQPHSHKWLIAQVSIVTTEPARKAGWIKSTLSSGSQLFPKWSEKYTA